MSSRRRKVVELTNAEQNRRLVYHCTNQLKIKTGNILVQRSSQFIEETPEGRIVESYSGYVGLRNMIKARGLPPVNGGPGGSCPCCGGNLHD